MQSTREWIDLLREGDEIVLRHYNYHYGPAVIESRIIRETKTLLVCRGTNGKEIKIKKNNGTSGRGSFSPYWVIKPLKEKLKHLAARGASEQFVKNISQGLSDLDLNSIGDDALSELVLSLNAVNDLLKGGALMKK